MQSKTKRTTPKTVAAATTDGVSSKPTDPRSASRAPECRAELRRCGGRSARPALGVLASCAAVLLTSRHRQVGRRVCHTCAAARARRLCVLRRQRGRPFVRVGVGARVVRRALSGSAIAAIVTELDAGRAAHSGPRVARQSTDARAAMLRDLGFASAVIGALVVDDHVLGAVVLAVAFEGAFHGSASSR